MTTPTVAAQRLGQSIWTDNISRQLIESGELEQLVQDGGVLGLTSNPSIFQRAIGESNDYDPTIAGHLDETAEEIYERLALRDIQNVADILAPVYQRTGSLDGYVSLEVSPLIANDTEKTVAEAKRLFAAADRPNVMIKIPGTPAGIPAIEQAIAAGVNVNVTLLFNVDNYEDVAHAYIRGLKQRLDNGEDVTNIASVASFFLGRIDVMVDRILMNNIRSAQGRDLDRVASNRKLLGKAAIANAKLAYQRFLKIFEGDAFAELREAGAMMQRPLWASTYPRNPNYPDTMYVDTLIGKHTVNTLPPDTLAAFLDHGTAEEETLTQDIDDAHHTMTALQQVGIDFEQVTRQLQEEGVERFAESFEQLIDQVYAKSSVLRTGIVGNQKLALGIYREKVEQALNKFGEAFVNGRVWNKDASVWKDHQPVMNEISNRLGWLDVAETIDRNRLQALQEAIKVDDTVDDVLVLGMGGSSLAPDVLSRVFGPQDGYPTLHVLDSTDPAQIQHIQDTINVDKTLFIVASKSGTTLETRSFFQYFWELTGGNGQHFIAITDEDSKLQTLAEENDFRDVFINPSDIGGRYSALSYFGMVPAALMGLDLNRMWEEADNMLEACGDLIPPKEHPALWLGAIMGQMAREGRDKLMLFASEPVASFGYWAEQLIAESTGKENRSILPVAGATVGKPHDYGSDRVFVYLKLEGDPSNEALDQAVRTLREAGHPRVTYMLPDKYALAGEFFRWEYGTAIAGHMLNINPFDEPNVSEAKSNTNELLETYTTDGQLPAQKPLRTENDVHLYINRAALTPLTELCEAHGFNKNSLTDLIAAQIIGTHAGDYFALLAYAPYLPPVQQKLDTLQKRIRHLTRRAVTQGYGPRYLHSTGQLHKGGANNGVFFQFTYDTPNDIDIPGAGYSFGVLNTAQAAGDMQALYDHKRRAIRIHATSGDIHAALDAMLTALDIVEQRRQ